MRLSLLAGQAHPRLVEAIAQRLGCTPAARVIKRFPDDELHVSILESVRGGDVYIIQPTSPPAETHLFELFLLADACRRAGAARLTAVVPYFGYARQDRRASGREPVSARLVADLLQVSGIQRLIAVDVHSRALEGFFRIPFEHLSAVDALTERLRPLLPTQAVVVAPDLGAAKLATTYARLLGLPVAIVHKIRLSGQAVSVSAISGDVRGRAPLIIDDMISTGGTVEAAARAVLDAGARPELLVAATHGLLVDGAKQRLGGLPLQRFFTTDTVPTRSASSLPVEVVSVAPLLAEAIRRLHEDRSLGGLLSLG